MNRMLNSWFTWSGCFALCLISTFLCPLRGAEIAKGLVIIPSHQAPELPMHVTTEAISIHERSSIIEHLAERGKWEMEQDGARIQIVRFNAREMLIFCFAVQARGLVVDGRRGTADAAIDACIDAVKSLIDPHTRIRPIAKWGSACERGFVSDARFGPGDTVIKRTNRNVTRRWLRSEHA